MISEAAAYLALASEATQAQWKDLAEYHAANPRKEKFVYMRRKFLSTITDGLNAAYDLIEAQQAEIERLKAEARRGEARKESWAEKGEKAIRRMQYALCIEFRPISDDERQGISVPRQGEKTIFYTYAEQDPRKEEIRLRSLQQEHLRMEQAYARSVAERKRKARRHMMRTFLNKKARQAMPAEPVH